MERKMRKRWQSERLLLGFAKSGHQITITINEIHTQLLLLSNYTNIT